MTEHKQRIRCKVAFPGTFSGDHAGMRVVYNLGVGGCKMISHRKIRSGDHISVHLNIPKHKTPISIRTARVQWILEHGFGAEFLEIQGQERDRLEQFLATQVHVAS